MVVRAAGMLLVRVLAGVAARAMPQETAVITAEVLEQDRLLALTRTHLLAKCTIMRQRTNPIHYPKSSLGYTYSRLQ